MRRNWSRKNGEQAASTTLWPLKVCLLLATMVMSQKCLLHLSEFMCSSAVSPWPGNRKHSVSILKTAGKDSWENTARLQGAQQCNQINDRSSTGVYQVTQRLCPLSTLNVYCIHFLSKFVFDRRHKRHCRRVIMPFSIHIVTIF